MCWACSAAILSATWPAHAGVMCRGVNWQRFDKQQLLDICDCIGGLGLAAVLRLMAEDHAGATGEKEITGSARGSGLMVATLVSWWFQIAAGLLTLAGTKCNGQHVRTFSFVF
eukprot:GHRR01024584.1.p3 GENE.GHRR01024584.1~~GHRR01024584.1.p3  ORF type:complete len:113 (+),score=38.04 GHRR01024584.1:416-754(+)